MRAGKYIAAGVTVSASLCFAQPRGIPAHAPTNAPTPEMLYYVNEYSEHYGVPRELVIAIIEQESDWNPRAVSGKGAVGLMQLMPGTWPRYGVEDPNDISQNIGAGVHYLADLLAQFRDFRLAVASYYCGSRYPIKRGLAYANGEVTAYVKSVHERYQHQLEAEQQENRTGETR